MRTGKWSTTLKAPKMTPTNKAAALANLARMGYSPSEAARIAASDWMAYQSTFSLHSVTKVGSSDNPIFESGMDIDVGGKLFMSCHYGSYPHVVFSIARRAKERTIHVLIGSESRENMRKFIIAASLAAISFGTGLAYGEEQAGLETIQVIGARERLVPYQESYDFAKKVQAASGGRVALGFCLMAAKPDVRLDDLRLTLDGDTESLPIQVREGGIFIVPVDDRIAQEKGAYTVNKKKGDLSYSLVFLPAVGNNEWTIGLMRQVVADAKSAIGKVLPWYLKPFATRIDSIAICTKESGVAISIMDGDTLVATVKTEKKDIDDIGRGVFCKRFNESEKFEDTARVVVPEGAEVLLL